MLLGLYGAVGHLVVHAAGRETTDAFRSAELVAIPLTVAGTAGLLYLWPPVQRIVARVIPVRSGSPVVYLTIVLGLFLVAYAVGAKLQPGPPLTFGDLLAQDIPLFFLAFVAVGIFVRRSPRETIERLGLIPPLRARWWVVAILGIGVFLAVAIGIEALASAITPSQQKQVSDITSVLFSRFNNPAAIVFLGVVAGIVEETLFRGALLPRFGVIVSALLFAALHTQYAVTFATLEVFVLGLGLGWLRVRSGSTLPSMLTHAGYDIAVGFLSLLAK